MGEEPKTKKKSLLLFEHSRFSVYLHESEPADDTPVVLQVCVKDNADADPTQAANPCATSVDDAAGAIVEEPVQVLCEEGLTYVVKRKDSDLFLEFGPDEPTALAGSVQAATSVAGCWYGCDDDESDSLQVVSSEASSAMPSQAIDRASSEFKPPPRSEIPASASGAKTSETSSASPAAGLSTAAPSSKQPSDEASAVMKPDAAVAPAVQTPAGPSEDPSRAPRPFADRGWNAIRLAGWAWVGCDMEDEVPLAPKDSPLSAAPVPGKSSATSSAEAAPARQGEDPLVTEVKTTNTADIEDDPCSDGCLWYFGGESLKQSMQQRRAVGGATLNVPGSQMELVHLTSSKVEWRIWGITAKMKNYPKGSRVFSPEFEAFNVSNLGLVFYPNGNSNAKQGFCSLGLKAPHGTHLRYKLYIGSTERFTDLRHNVTESWGFVDMCKVEDELQQDEDLLRLGVEIIDDIDAHETLKNVGTSKVEWVVSSMQNKLMHYRKDVALYSNEFSAGGVDKLRLKFYPAGKKEADLGWCSLYLEAPKGSELRCRLSVGKKSMSFDRLEKFGEDSIWGFLTLCKLRDELEQDGDTVRVGLEVLETKRLDGRLSESEDAYLKTLNVEKRTWLLNELDRIEKLRNSGDGVPSRFRILNLELPDQAKAVALSKLDAMHSDVLSGESSKLKKWIDGLLSIPFGSIRKPLVSIDEGKAKVQKYLEKAQAALDEAVFGHEEPKKKIVQLLCQWIANPQSMSLVLGIQGPPGNGKTTLCRKGIAEALERPFVQISLGGATDASVLEGHSYTYVGSTWGRIAGLIMEAQCMNPVIFFDELDKVSDTPRGEEIIGVLTHLTDHSQNKTFTDRYFEGIPLDLSRALYIFSFNDESRLNHVLKDRLTVIHTEGFDQTAKLKISREYLMPELLANVGMKKGDVDIGREELNYLCTRCGVPVQEGGVRGIKQSLEAVILHLNEIRMTQDFDLEHKADAGEKKVDTCEEKKADGEAKAPGEHKADGAQKADIDSKRSRESKAHGERKADDGKEKRPEEGGEAEGDATKERQSVETKKKGKKLRVELPVNLTCDLIEQLVTKKIKKDVPAMMYI